MVILAKQSIKKSTTSKIKVKALFSFFSGFYQTMLLKEHMILFMEKVVKLGKKGISMVIWIDCVIKIQISLKGSIHPLTSVKFIIINLKECVNTRITKRICLRKTILWSSYLVLFILSCSILIAHFQNFLKMQLKEGLYHFSNKWKFKHIQWNAFQIKLYGKNMKIAYHHNKKEKDITRNRRWILRLFLRVCSQPEKKLCTCRNISKKKSVILKVKSFMPPTDSKSIEEAA